MNKTEMAEWLIKNVLKADKHESDTMNVWCLNPGLIEVYPPSNLCKFFYSPDGFFAVWDAVMEKLPNHEIAFSVTTDKSLCYAFINHVDADPEREFNQFGKDRYESFYNAVYKALGGNDAD